MSNFHKYRIVLRLLHVSRPDVTWLFLADDGGFASKAERQLRNFLLHLLTQKNRRRPRRRCMLTNWSPTKVRKPLQACAEVAEMYHCCDHLRRESWNELQCGTLDRPQRCTTKENSAAKRNVPTLLDACPHVRTRQQARYWMLKSVAVGPIEKQPPQHEFHTTSCKGV